MSKIVFVAKSHLEMVATMANGSTAFTLPQAEEVHASLGAEVARMRAMARRAVAEAAGVKFGKDGPETAEGSLRS